MAINRGIRKYRKGPDVRTGDISEKLFKKEFCVKDINFSDKYTEEDKQTILNYSYDSFYDLSNVLQCPVELIALQAENGIKSSITFGENIRGAKNLVISKDGHIAVNWFAYLDKYLGFSFCGVSDGILKNINNLDSIEIVQLFKELLQKLKKKKIDAREQDSKEINNYRENLEKLLEKLPIQSDRNIDEVMEVEDTISRFVSDLSRDKLMDMFNAFNKYNIEIGILKDEILKEFNRVEQERLKIERQSESVLVDTDFYTQMKKIYSEDSLNSYLVYIAFENYVKLKLKEEDRSNNILVGLAEIKGINFNPSEQYVFYNAFKELLSVLIPTLVDAICMNENSEDEESEFKEVEMENRVEQIEKVLENDKGKFKLTYFKELAKNHGYTLDENINDRGIGGCYYIKMSKGYIGYVRIPVYNHPKDKNHIAVAYKEDNSEIDRYVWDGPVDYNKLISFFDKIEEKNSQKKDDKPVEVKNERVEDIKNNKFRLNDFKQLCIKNKLKVSLEETPKQGNKYIIQFKNSYISYILVPIEYSLKDNINEVSVKTVKETLTYNWKGYLSDEVLNKLIIYLIHIEKEGLIKVKQEVTIKTGEIEKEKKELVSKIDEIKAEKKQEDKLRDKISKLQETKDLREFLKNYAEDFVNKNHVIPYNNLEDLLVEYHKNNLYTITFIGKLAKQDPQGHSKNWILDSNTIYIIDKSNYRKSQEGIIESIVTTYINNYLKDRTYSKKYVDTITQGVVYMICKVYKLDVRTYCVGKDFESLMKMSDAEKEKYIKKVFGFFKKTIGYFVKKV